MLGLGLWISTRASTREAAGQMAMGTVMPSIFLSGYVFPLDSMPRFFWYVAQVIPTTWLIDAARGVILRGAGWAELWRHAVVLWIMALDRPGLQHAPVPQAAGMRRCSADRDQGLGAGDRLRPIHFDQSSTTRLGTRWKSRTFRVTTIA